MSDDGSYAYEYMSPLLLKPVTESPMLLNVMMHGGHQVHCEVLADH